MAEEEVCPLTLSLLLRNEHRIKLPQLLLQILSARWGFLERTLVKEGQHARCVYEGIYVYMGSTNLCMQLSCMHVWRVLHIEAVLVVRPSQDVACKAWLIM